MSGEAHAISEDYAGGPTDAERAIHDAYTAYADAFARDPAAAASCCGIPTLIVLPREIVAANSQAELEAFFANGLSRLQSSGYSHSKLGARNLKWVNATTAIYSIAFVRLKKDGSKLERSAATYLFRNDGGTWKIFGLIATDPDKVL